MDEAGVLQSQGMLTQVSTPNPKYKLNISSFPTLLHPSDCIIYATDIIIIVLLMQMMWGWEVWKVVNIC